MSTGDFRFLLAGTGNIASTYCKAVAELPGLTVAGCVSRSGKRPDGSSPDLPVFSSISQADIGYDAVILATPNGCHVSACLEAAALGKHVFTEKVLALTRNDMDAMIRTCRENNVKLAVAFQRRTVPDNRTVHDMLQAKAFGRVVSCELSIPFWRDQAYYDSAAYRGTYSIDGGGPFMQQASHNIDLYAWFFGLPEKVRAFAGTFLHTMEAEDYGSAILLHPDGMIGTITASTASKPGFDAVMTIHTERGTLSLKGDRIVLWEMDGLPNPSCCNGEILHSGASSASVTAYTGHKILLADFAEKCRTGGDVLVSGEDAKNATELILRIYEAVRQERI